MKRESLQHRLRLIHKEITFSRHDAAALQAQLQPLHSLTEWRLCRYRALSVWQVSLTKAYLRNMLRLTSKQTAEIYNHNESTVSYNILYASDEPNTIVSLCLDKKKRKKRRRTNHISIYRGHSSVLTMSCISYKIPKQSPYSPWQYKCSHNGKKNPECEMKWYKKSNNLGNRWTVVKSEINTPVLLQ